MTQEEKRADLDQTLPIRESAENKRSCPFSSATLELRSLGSPRQEGMTMGASQPCRSISSPFPHRAPVASFPLDLPARGKRTRAPLQQGRVKSLRGLRSARSGPRVRHPTPSWTAFPKRRQAPREDHRGGAGAATSPATPDFGGNGEDNAQKAISAAGGKEMKWKVPPVLGVHTKPSVPRLRQQEERTEGPH